MQSSRPIFERSAESDDTVGGPCCHVASREKISGRNFDEVSDTHVLRFEFGGVFPRAARTYILGFVRENRIADFGSRISGPPVAGLLREIWADDILNGIPLLESSVCQERSRFGRNRYEFRFMIPRYGYNLVLGIRFQTG